MKHQLLCVLQDSIAFKDELNEWIKYILSELRIKDLLIDSDIIPDEWENLKSCWNWRCGRASGVIQNGSSIKDNRSLFECRFYIFTVGFVCLFCITLQYRCYVLMAPRKESIMYYDIVESGKRIKEMRKKAGMTQEELADAIGMTREALARIETGKNGTSVDGIINFAHYF